VRDHGEVVDPVKARRVSERFFRRPLMRPRQWRCNALGLTIVAARVSAHKGRVGVAATPTVATLVVDLATANSQPAPSNV
jgi:hypothetical protein